MGQKSSVILDQGADDLMNAISFVIMTIALVLSLAALAGMYIAYRDLHR